MSDEITLTNDQQAALDRFVQFLMNPLEHVMVIEGFAGTGKTTLIHTLLDRLPSFIKTIELLDANYEPLEIKLSATTHKAAETFARATGMDCGTIHSVIGARLYTDFHTGKSELSLSKNAQALYHTLLFVDEASMIDGQLLTLITQQVTDSCKLVYIGDPAQLPPVKKTEAPVFKVGFPTARLTEVMRQQVNGVPMANPITELATLFRLVVQGEPWPSKFKPDGQYVVYVDRAKYKEMIDAEFTRPDWHYADSKILAWTNDRVIEYNKYVRSVIKGDPALQAGDYADNNQYITIGKDSIKTDATVYINEVEPDSYEHGVLGNWVTVQSSIRVFHPRYRKDKEQAAKKLRAEKRYKEALEVDNWIDLRAVFAQTVNKSQGSTYERVFVDLDDISKCRQGNLLARMLYVAISRARSQVILVGDIKK